MRHFVRILVALWLSVTMVSGSDQAKLPPAQQEVVIAHEARAKASSKIGHGAFFRDLLRTDCTPTYRE
jgi:hypothetical protein